MFRIFACLWLLIALAACQFGAPPETNELRLPVRLINFWERVEGSLSSAGELQPFQFVGAQGDGIQAQAQSAASITLKLEDKGGLLLMQAEKTLVFTLPENGVYTLAVQSPAAASYELELTYTDRPSPSATATLTPTITATPTNTPTPTATLPYYARLGTFVTVLQSNQLRPGEFSVPEERHVYTFEGRTRQYIQAQAVRLSGEIDPVIRLFDPNGLELATDDDSGGHAGALLRNVQLAQDGLYSLQVWGRGLAGTYQISLLMTDLALAVTPTFVAQSTWTPIPDSPTPTLKAAISGENLYDHLPVIGSIERPGDFDRYPISAAQGQTLTIGLTLPPDSTLRPIIEVYDPEGSLVARATPAASNARGDAFIPALLAAQNGAYVIFVTGERDSIGEYIIAYGDGVSHQDVAHGLTTADQVYAGDLPKRGLRDVWNLDLQQEDVINAAVSAVSGGLDPVLELVAPDGSQVAMDDNGGGGTASLIASARAPVSGRYQLRVVAANASSDGKYTLVWRYINLAPTPTPLPGTVLLLSYKDIVPDNTYQYYAFYGQAGTQVHIQAIAQPGSSLDPVAALLDADGNLIAEGDDSQGDLNPRFTATLPTDGSYRVRVNGYLSSGPFELTVEQLYAAH
jgi:hypothetical protein